MTYEKEFGYRLASLRAKHGWSMEYVSEKIGVSRESICRWENGHCAPRADKVADLSKLFGITSDELLGLRKPAQWLPVPGKSMAVYCSNCRHVDIEQTDYCPDCGFPMLKEGQT